MHLPENVTVEDTCRYRGGDFKDLQETYSTIPESLYYYFTANPDLVFTKKVVCTHAHPSTSDTTVSLGVTMTATESEYTDIIEAKMVAYLVAQGQMVHHMQSLKHFLHYTCWQLQPF